MHTAGTHHGAWRVLRVVLAAAGAAIVLLTLVGDRLGSEAQSGFGRTQVQLMVVGVLLVLAGGLGRSAAQVYKGAAIILLNTIVLFFLLELGAAVLLPLVGPTAERTRTTTVPTEDELPYYASRAWGAQYWREHRRVDHIDRYHVQRYHPYIIWRQMPFRGSTINVDENGIRRTPGGDCRSGSYRVFALGGSTLWGIGAPDWATIPAYLQALLARRLARPVCVVNYGEWAFTSTQNLIQLVRRLQAGDIPDLVIDYSGVNEIITAHFYAQAGLHWDMEQIAAKLEGRTRDLTWLQSLNVVRLLGRFVQIPAPVVNGKRYQFRGKEYPDTLDEEVARVYLSNYRMVAAIARAYGFHYHFFWQPNAVVGRKPLTALEQRIKAELGPSYTSLIRRVYPHVERAAAEYENLHYLADVFDRESSFVYIDWHHLTPEGNQLVARRMLQTMDRSLPTVSGRSKPEYDLAPH